MGWRIALGETATACIVLNGGRTVVQTQKSNQDPVFASVLGSSSGWSSVSAFVYRATSVITLTLLHPLQSTPVQSWTFEQESVVRIGRAADNQVVLYSAVVSRYHVEVQAADAGWRVVNLGTNGTYISGKRVEEYNVEDGMVIRLARSGPMIQIRMGPAPSGVQGEEAFRVAQEQAEKMGG